MNRFNYEPVKKMFTYSDKFQCVDKDFIEVNDHIDDAPLYKRVYLWIKISMQNMLLKSQILNDFDVIKNNKK